MPGIHQPAASDATPKRPSVKLGGVHQNGSRSKLLEVEMVSSDSSSSSPSSQDKLRRASWRDEHGDSLLEVHMVFDTHYKRTFWKRHSGTVLCFCVLVVPAVILVVLLLHSFLMAA